MAVLNKDFYKVYDYDIINIIMEEQGHRNKMYEGGPIFTSETSINFKVLEYNISK